MTKIRNIQDMDNPERSRYFRVIDQLRGFGISEDLPLPQASHPRKIRAQSSNTHCPSSLDDETQKNRSLEFDMHLDVNELSGSKFTWILDEAAKFMGLPNSDDQDIETSTKRFSADILRIDTSGPDQHPLH
ncbi:hypothetical protein TOPH_09244 [Tolypocladium ophioglossoides CBS 100239]|uniref:Uncharacterized protein n=1 Tax=Tolypocladium ophioglossoides (strain CBS 100239) TaxID=1163406 RepID=A0A0L0MXD8_TOLOC|nr:hypothetical protein TOPH_09244 [Tolypocladium ophioglossoides CBS 100239]